MTNNDEDIDMKIGRYLLRMPSATSAQIAEALNCSKNWAQQRAQFVKTEVLASSFNVKDWDAVGLAHRYRIDIQINQRKLRAGGGPDDLTDFLSSDFVNTDWLPGSGKIEIRRQEQLGEFIMHQLPGYTAWQLSLSKETAESSKYLSNYIDRVFIQDLTMVLGNQADLSVAVRVNNTRVIRRFVTDGLRLLSGVNNTTTSQEIWSAFEQ